MSTTVVIVSYQYGHLASHAIESVLSQTKQPDRILLVDDGAHDCASVSARYGIESVHRQSNLGIVANFQDILMNRVQTDRVLFLGADNWLRDDALEKLCAVDADIVTYDIQVTGSRKDEILQRHPGEVVPYRGGYYWDRSSGHHGSMLYNVAMAREVGGYASPPGRTIEDMVLYHRLRDAGATRIHVPEALLYYRRHTFNFNIC